MMRYNEQWDAFNTERCLTLATNAMCTTTSYPTIQSFGLWGIMKMHNNKVFFYGIVCSNHKVNA